MTRIFSSLAILIIMAFMVFRPEDLPPSLNLLTPLELDAAPNLVSRWKTRRTVGNADSCRAALNRSQAIVSFLKDHEHSDVCHIRNQTRLTGLSTARMAPMATTCEMAVRLYLWEQHALQPAAMRTLGSKVARIEHYESFSCRGMRTASGIIERMSEHATANAVDIAGFILEDGRRIRLRSDWTGDGDEAAFLRAARDGLCRWFNVVLSPDYNTLHADHFHADMGRWHSCR